jgi:flagellar hook assembly protein FlgD
MRAGGRGRGTVLRFNWDGRDRHGRLVRAGLYRFTVSANARGYHRTARGTIRVVRRS